MEKKAVLVVAALITRANDAEKRILVVRRGPTQSGAGFWEFPGGKVEKGETPEEALVREIQEELSIKIQVKSFLAEEDYAYPSKLIRLRVYWTETEQQDLRLSEHDAYKWSLPEEINEKELSEADRPFVKKIRQGSK
ncbi:MAG: (deoxy)nucleoside triphosphate pyrophosphohydrolase [Bdellovibrio sp.]